MCLLFYPHIYSICLCNLSYLPLLSFKSLRCAIALTRTHIIVFSLFKFWGFPFGQALDCSCRNIRVCGCYLQMQQGTSKIDSHFTNYQCSLMLILFVFAVLQQFEQTVYNSRQNNVHGIQKQFCCIRCLCTSPTNIL